MKAAASLFCLLALTIGNTLAAEIAAQEFTVMTGITESTVVSQLQILPVAGETGALVTIPVLLPRATAAAPATAYAAAQPSLAIGPRSFVPTGFRIAGQSIPGLPSDWEIALFQFQIPPQFAGRGFIGKVMYVQPKIKDATPFLSLSSQAPLAASKITFLPGNNHTLGLLSRNSQPAALEDGMLSMRPVAGELILVGRSALPEPKRVAQEEKIPKKKYFGLKNPFDFLPKRKLPKPEATPQPILPTGPG